MKTVFMDLQGTLGGNPIGDISDFEFYPRALEALKLLFNHGCRLIVITNQSRIAKGYLTMETYESKRQKIVATAEAYGIDNLEFYCCPHRNEDNCKCKKPKTELFNQANEKEAIDKETSYMIGDMGMSDMLFAHNLKIKKALVLTGVGQGSLNEYRSTWQETEAEYVGSDIYEAATWIINI